MNVREMKIQSLSDGTMLNVTVAEPDAGLAVKGVIQIAHGMCEYVGRYTPMMEYFTSCGYVVAGNDHRGHGKSVSDEKDLGWFGGKDGSALVQDLAQVSSLLKETYPGLPLVLFGHSMGSMASMVYLQEHDVLIDKLILSGSPTKNPASKVAIFLSDAISLFRGARHRSKMLYSLSIGAYEKKFKSEGKASWLSVNRENVEKYVVDPYCTYVFTCNGFRNLFSLLTNAYQAKRYVAKNANLPIFFMAGGDDPVIGSEKQWRSAQEFLRQGGYQKVDGKLYAGYRHELLNESNPTVYYEAMLSFIEGATT